MHADRQVFWTRCLRWYAAGALLLLIPVSTAAAGDDGLSFARTVDCLAAPDGPGAAQQEDPAEARPPGKLPPRREIERPVDRREIQTLLGDLERVPVEGQERRARRFVVKESPLGAERFEVVLGDVSTALLVLQAEDGRALIEGMELPPRAEDWLHQAYDRIRDCGLHRYEGWGGEPVFDSILELVAAYREELERLELGGLPGGGMRVDWKGKPPPPGRGGPP